MPIYQTSNPLARTSPLRSIPLFRSATGIVPFTALQTAEWNLAIAVRDLPLAEKYYAHTCKTFGDANRVRGSMRRFWQGKAFRNINVARAQLRAARKALAAAQLAVLLAAPVVQAG